VLRCLIGCGICAVRISHDVESRDLTRLRYNDCPTHSLHFFEISAFAAIIDLNIRGSNYSFITNSLIGGQRSNTCSNTNAGPFSASTIRSWTRIFSINCAEALPYHVCHLDIALLNIGTAIAIVTIEYARSTSRSGMMMFTFAFSITTFLSASAA